MVNENIGERVKQIRLNEGLSQREFAKKLNINSASVVCGWEKNARPIKDQYIKLISEIYGYCFEYIKYGTGDVKTAELDNTSKIISILKTLYDFDDYSINVALQYINLKPKDRQIVNSYLKKLNT